MHWQVEKPMAHDRRADHPRAAPVAPNGIVPDAEEAPHPTAATRLCEIGCETKSRGLAAMRPGTMRA